MADKPATVAAKPQAQLEPYQELQQRLAKKAEASAIFAREDAWELAKNAVNAITSATTADELFDASEKASGLASMGREWQHLNNPIVIVEVDFRQSDDRFKEGTLGYYAVVHYVLANAKGEGTEEIFVVGVGASNVVSFLEKLDALEGEEKRKGSHLVVRSKTTGRGDMLYITRPQ